MLFNSGVRDLGSQVDYFAAPACLRQPANLVSFETCGAEGGPASDRAVLYSRSERSSTHHQAVGLKTMQLNPGSSTPTTNVHNC